MMEGGEVSPTLLGTCVNGAFLPESLSADTYANNTTYSILRMLGVVLAKASSAASCVHQEFIPCHRQREQFLASVKVSVYDRSVHAKQVAV